MTRCMIGMGAFALALVCALPARADGPAAAQQASSAVELLAGSTRVVLRPDDDQATAAAHFPISLPHDVVPAEVTPKVISVLAGVRDDLLPRTAITPSIRGSAENPPLELVLDFAREPFAPPGQYEVRLDLAFADKAKLAPQSLSVLVTVPSASLAVPPRLALEQIDGKLENIPTIRTTELSGLSRATISAAMALDANQQLSHLAVVMGPQGILVPRGGSADLQLALSGEFPLGTTGGFIELQSRELAQPAKIAFEVKARRSLWYILAFAGLGLIAGYLTRNLFARLIAVGEARRTASESLARLDAELAEHQDPTFRKELEKLRLPLVREANAWNPTAITTAVSKAEEGRTAALAVLAARKAEAKKRFDALDGLRMISAGLPRPLKRLFDAVTPSIRQIADLLDVDNVDDCEKGLREVEEGLSAEVSRTLADWTGHANTAVSALAPLDAISDDVAAKKKVALDALAAIPAGPAGEELKPALRGAVTASWRIADLETSLFETQRVAAERLQLLGPGRPEMAALAGDLRTIGAQRPSSRDEPEELLYLERQLEPRFKAAGRALIPASLSAAERQPIEQVIDSGRYLMAIEVLQTAIAAAAAAAAAAAKAPGLEGSPQGARPQPAVRAVAAQTFLPPFSGRVEGASAPGIHEPMRTSGDVRARRPKINVQLMPRLFLSAKFAAAMLIGLILSAVAIPTFAPSFVGTPNDLLGVFLWSFVLNASADTIASAAARVGQSTNPQTPPPPPPPPL